METIYGLLYICSFFLLAFLLAKTFRRKVNKNLFFSLLGLSLVLFAVLRTFPSDSLAHLFNFQTTAIIWLNTYIYELYFGLMTALTPEISERLFSTSSKLKFFYSCVLIFIIPLVYTLTGFIGRRITDKLSSGDQEVSSGGLVLLGGVTGAGLLGGVILFLNRGVAANVSRLFGGFLLDHLGLTMVIILSEVLSVVYATATLKMIDRGQKVYLNLVYTFLIALFLGYVILLFPFLAVSLLMAIDLLIGFIAPAWPW